MKIAVVALGKIGLPLAAHFASKGHQVVGVDISVRTVHAVNAGVEPFPGEAHLGEYLQRCVGNGTLRATTDYADAVPGADVVLVVVPLFVQADGTPEFDRMDAATASIAAHLAPGTLVAYETTLPVGTTSGRWVPALEAGSGLRCGQDFFVAYSPERVLTGRVFADLRRYPKIVGGVDAESGARAVKFYEQVLDFDERPDLPRPNGVWQVRGAEEAEFVKLAETTYRDVNIALANEFARYAESARIDVYDVIEASNSQPYSHIHSPGIAVGGHCIPVYPRLYLWNDPGAATVRTARDTNESMPRAAVDRLADLLDGGLAGRRVVVLGAAYRGGVKETAFSGVHQLVRALAARGADVVVHDPLYTDEELRAEGFAPYAAGSGSVDAAVLQADHAEYAQWGPVELPDVKVLLDGRHMVNPEQWPGVRVASVGVG